VIGAFAEATLGAVYWLFFIAIGSADWLAPYSLHSLSGTCSSSLLSLADVALGGPDWGNGRFLPPDTLLSSLKAVLPSAAANGFGHLGRTADHRQVAKVVI
jgi:hypothetical protein